MKMRDLQTHQPLRTVQYTPLANKIGFGLPHLISLARQDWFTKHQNFMISEAWP